MATDFASLTNNEKAAFAAGGATLILSFFPDYISYSGFGISAWHGYATLGVLLAIVATTIVGFKAFAPEMLPEGVPWNLAAFASAAIGAILLVLRSVTITVGGPGWSGFLLFIAVIALGFFTFRMFKESGEKAPEMGRHKPTI